MMNRKEREERDEKGDLSAHPVSVCFRVLREACARTMAERTAGDLPCLDAEEVRCLSRNGRVQAVKTGDLLWYAGSNWKREACVIMFAV